MAATLLVVDDEEPLRALVVAVFVGLGGSGGTLMPMPGGVPGFAGGAGCSWPSPAVAATVQTSANLMVLWITGIAIPTFHQAGCGRPDAGAGLVLSPSPGQPRAPVG